jgi:hypothetical protein
MPIKIPRETLLQHLKDVGKKLNRTPKVRDCKYSQKPFEREFGTFNQALLAAGFSDIKYREVPKSEIARALMDLAAKKGTLTYETARNNLCFDLSVVERAYGSWSKAVAEILGKPNTFRGTSNDELLEKIRETELLYGKATGELLTKHAKIRRSLLIRRFGSSAMAYELAGVAPVAEPGLQRWVFRLITKELGDKIKKEKSFTWLKSPRGFPMRVDGYVASRMLCIEFDGIQHFQFTKEWHGTLEYFEYRKACDKLKEKLLLENGFSVVRFRWDDQISEELVRERLAEAAKAGP